MLDHIDVYRPLLWWSRSIDLQISTMVIPRSHLSMLRSRGTTKQAVLLSVVVKHIESDSVGLSVCLGSMRSGWFDTTQKTICLSIYLGFYVAFNTKQVISQLVVLWAQDTSTYSWSRLCTVNWLPIMGKKLPSFQNRVRGLNQSPQRWAARVLPLCHRHLFICGETHSVWFSGTLIGVVCVIWHNSENILHLGPFKKID